MSRKRDEAHPSCEYGVVSWKCFGGESYLNDY